MFKQTVFYTRRGNYTSQGITLYGIENHPRLGNMEIAYTSPIVREDPDGTIETVNTIYKRKQ